MWVSYKMFNKNYILNSCTIDNKPINSNPNTEVIGINPTNMEVIGTKPKRQNLLKTEQEILDTVKKYDLLMQELFLLHKAKLDYATPIEVGKYCCSNCDPLYKLYMETSSFTKALIHLKNS